MTFNILSKIRVSKDSLPRTFSNLSKKFLLKTSKVEPRPRLEYTSIFDSLPITFSILSKMLVVLRQSYLNILRF